MDVTKSPLQDLCFIKEDIRNKQYEDNSIILSVFYNWRKDLLHHKQVYLDETIIPLQYLWVITNHSVYYIRKKQYDKSSITLSTFYNWRKHSLHQKQAQAG